MRVTVIAKLLRAAIAAGLGVLLAGACGGRAAFAASAEIRTSVILANLPRPGSAAYETLANLARGAHREPLDMTSSEMWSVPSDKLDAFAKAASAHGVKLTKIGTGPFRLLAPMAAGARMTTGQKAMMDHTMGLKSVMGVEMMSLPEAGATEYALAGGMRAKAPGTAPPALSIRIDRDTSLTVRRTAVAKTKDGYVWRGEVEGTGEAVTLLWWPSGRLTGSFPHRNRTYMLKDAGGGMHAVVEVAPNMLPPEHAPAGLEMLRKMKMTSDPLVKQGDASMLRPFRDGPAEARPRREETRNVEDAGLGGRSTARPAPGIARSALTPRDSRTRPVTITVIAASTKEAASYYGDIAKDLIALAIEDANQSFRNSGIGHIQLELVHTYETGYAESGSHFDHVWRFADKGDGFMEEIHALRDEHEADVAILVAHDPMGCGLATRVAASAEEAFAAVHHECMATMYSLAHEVGHIIGARHDRALDQSPGPFPYGHGFVNGTKWRTMMAYKDTCGGCPRLPVWSSPDVKVKGVRAGSRTTDNAKVVREQAARVAGFR